MVKPEECLFCKIAKGEVPAKKVLETADALAFLDINPRNPGHTLVVPKKHKETLFELSEDEAGKLFKTVRKVAGMVMAGTKAEGMSIAQSNGTAAGQVVAHLHFHVIPRFMSEGPMGLEGVLSVKRLPEEVLDKLVEAIKTGKEEKAPAKEEKPAKKEDEDEISFEF
jgi:histidine triad (HIT) family protein